MHFSKKKYWFNNRYIYISKDYFYYLLAALSYFDVALAEVDFEIEFALEVWPICLPKFSTLDINLR